MWNFFASRVYSFRHAFNGWWYALRTQRNTWIHAVIATLVFIMSAWLGISRQEWAIIILTATMVFAAEFINTAIEAIVDLASPEKHPLAKVGKDVGAAAVLIAAIAAILVGLLILGPPLLEKLKAVF